MAPSLQQLGGQIRRWREDPVLFVRDVFKATPDAWQAKVLEAYADNPRIALKASKGPGKTTVLSWAGWHFLTTYFDCKVVATSISGANLFDNLWSEFSKWQARSDLLKAAFHVGTDRITLKERPKTWWCSARTWAQDADATQQANTLAGLHADNMLFLIDEVGDIPDAVVATAEAGLANADKAQGRVAKLVIAGNPTRLAGPLYRACTSERRLWWVYEISGDPEDAMRAPRVSKEWAREQIEKYGRDSNFVRVNVYGEFPSAQSDKLLGVEDVARAAKRCIPRAEYIYEARIMGIDVARQGDDRSVVCKRQGRVCHQLRDYRIADTMELVGQITLQAVDFQPHAIFVDDVGIGAGVSDRLTQLGYPVTRVQSGAAAWKARPKFADLRAQMWWDMADWLRQGGCIPDDGELRAELLAPTYRFMPNNALRLQSKDELKKQGPSPDKADALAFTFAYEVPPPAVAQTPGLQQRSGRALTEYNPYAQERY